MDFKRNKKHLTFLRELVRVRSRPLGRRGTGGIGTWVGSAFLLVMRRVAWRGVVVGVWGLLLEA